MNPINSAPKKWNTKAVHISDIKAGDTVLCNDGQMRTVSNNDIGHCKLMGITLFGDSYNLGTKLVKTMIFK